MANTCVVAGVLVGSSSSAVLVQSRRFCGIEIGHLPGTRRGRSHNPRLPPAGAALSSPVRSQRSSKRSPRGGRRWRGLKSMPSMGLRRRSRRGKGFDGRKNYAHIAIAAWVGVVTHARLGRRQYAGRESRATVRSRRSVPGSPGLRWRKGRCRHEPRPARAELVAVDPAAVLVDDQLAEPRHALRRDLVGRLTLAREMVRQAACALFEGHRDRSEPPIR